MSNIQIYNYKESSIEFDFSNDNLMVNATQMAKLYNKLPAKFLGTEQTKNFIKECLRYPKWDNVNLKTEEDLVKISKYSGTWMHRILALKFAAWLDPAFELWVYSTIDNILFGRYRVMEESLKNSAQRRKKIDLLKNNLRQSDDYKELEILMNEERKAQHYRAQNNRNQLELFMELSQ